jgi:hypothetical protein
LLVGLLVMGAGWLGAPTPVPLYDGIGLPDEPYRYVAPPPFAPKTPPPGAATGEVVVSGGISESGQEMSEEFGPQVVLYFVEGAMSAPASASRITVSAVPNAPGPADAAIVGNVYSFTATSDAGPVGFTGKATADITLRAPSIASFLPVVRYRGGAGQAWHELPTERVGQDNFRARLEHTGDYALAPPSPRSAAPGSSGTARAAPRDGGSTGLIVGLVGTVAAMVLILLGLRLRTVRRRRGRPAARPARR